MLCSKDVGNAPRMRGEIACAHAEDPWREALRTRKQEQKLECGKRAEGDPCNGEKSGGIPLK